MSDAFYQAFEDKYRGSRTLIKSLLQVYEPYLYAVSERYPNGQTIDLVCGRGEWLEILSDHRFNGQGVDSNRVAVEICKQRGLNVSHTDPLELLKSLGNETQVIVSGFHLAEHIAFDKLKEITKEAYRVLKPGGILILETPNPENMLVGSNSFYFDPRHSKPIPPLLLAFLPEYYGFEKYKLLRMHEQGKSSRVQPLSLLDVFSGVSPTYAVIAQKTTGSSSNEFDIDLIEPMAGVKLDALTKVFDEQIAQQFLKTKNTAADNLEVAKNALALAKQAQDQLEFIHNTLLWKGTAPLRWLDHQVKLVRKLGLTERIKALLNKVVAIPVNKGANVFSRYPRLNAAGSSLTHKLGMYDWLCSYIVKKEVVLEPEVVEMMPLTPEIEAQAYKMHLRLEYMDSEAQRVYHDLKTAIQNREGLQ